MKIFKLKFIENEECNYIKFFLQKEDVLIKVYVYEDKEVFLNEGEKYDIGEKETPMELFEISFDDKLVEFISNGNAELFKFNKPEYKKIFEEFQELIKGIKN